MVAHSEQQQTIERGSTAHLPSPNKVSALLDRLDWIGLDWSHMIDSSSSVRYRAIIIIIIIIIIIDLGW